jgi:hypothetical protein
MSTYKDRSDYIKNIAMQNKLVAHNMLIDGSADQYRNSFFRVNDIEELNGAVVDWCHTPLVAHLGFDVRYKSRIGGALPHKTLNTTLWFLSKADTDTHSNRADAIEAAYVDADQVLTQFLSYMLADQDNCPCCMFDFETAKIEMVGPMLNELYGWQLQIQDSKSGEDLEYNPAHWLGNPDEEPAPPQDPGPSQPQAGNAEIIPLQGWESEMVIDWDDTRRARFGDAPTFQVYYLEKDGLRLGNNIIVQPDQVPPLATTYTITLNVPAPVVLTIKK